MRAIDWLAAWGLFLLILLVLAKTKIGSTLLYYLMWLAVLFLVVTHYKEITSILTAGGITPQS